MELRKDYILDRYVIISSGRDKRPFEFKKKQEAEAGKIDFFAPGNEHLTPPEIGRLGTRAAWKMRWFPNKFYAVEPVGNPVIRTDNKYFTFSSAYGYHEVIVETPSGAKQLSDLDVSDIKALLGVYSLRTKELLKDRNIRYVCVFKNHGPEAGTSISHSHSQIIAYNKIPALVKDKIDAAKRYDRCPYCEILNVERGSYRRCFENTNFVAFTPYASRYHYEIWVFPIRHVKSITDMNDDELLDLADILKRILKRLKDVDVSYNLELFYAPYGEDLHFHIEITPRMAIIGGFEILTDDVINSVSPEDAAKFYRGEV